jgi:hypothetical protein
MAEVRVDEWSGVEQRRHRRVPLRVPVICTLGEQRAQCHTENISISGLLVRSAATFPQDSGLTVEFTLPDSAGAVQIQARVAHEVPGVFMGLEFLAVAPAVQREIERYLAAAPVPVLKTR